MRVGATSKKIHGECIMETVTKNEQPMFGNKGLIVAIVIVAALLIAATLMVAGNSTQNTTVPVNTQSDYDYRCYDGDCSSESLLDVSCKEGSIGKCSQR